MRWTDEARTEAKRLWLDGFSAGVISETIRRDFGLRVSRNAVIGVIHRMKLQREGRGSVTTTKTGGQRRSRKRIAATTAMVPNRNSLGSNGPAHVAVSVPMVDLGAPAEPTLAPRILPVLDRRASAGPKTIMELTSAFECRRILDHRNEEGEALYCARPFTPGQTFSFCDECSNRLLTPIARSKLGKRFVMPGHSKARET